MVYDLKGAGIANKMLGVEQILPSQTGGELGFPGQDVIPTPPHPVTLLGDGLTSPENVRLGWVGRGCFA